MRCISGTLNIITPIYPPHTSLGVSDLITRLKLNKTAFDTNYNFVFLNRRWTPQDKPLIVDNICAGSGTIFVTLLALPVKIRKGRVVGNGVGSPFPRRLGSFKHTHTHRPYIKIYYWVFVSKEAQIKGEDL